LLQFQNDVAQAKLAKVQAMAALRQLLGFESVPDQFGVLGDLEYQPVHKGLDELKAMSLRTRPDLMAARQGVISAESQERLAEANAKQDLTATVDYSHVNATSGMSFFFNIPLAVFNRNQGEIARTKHAITQAQELASEAAEQAISDVVDAYYAVQMNDQIVQLYRGGYVDQAKESRDISEYAYRHGAASLLDFLDAERTYRANQLGYRQALASFMTALEQMRQAVGTRNFP
jgi:cobalt-zinc-cadmium efflux system outer membrane protein